MLNVSPKTKLKPTAFIFSLTAQWIRMHAVFIDPFHKFKVGSIVSIRWLDQPLTSFYYSKLLWGVILEVIALHCSPRFFASE